MNRRGSGLRGSLIALGLVAALAAPVAARADAAILTHVSYDVTRELYVELNRAFVAHWRAAGHGDVEIHQSHGGSTKQARAVIDGLEADVVSMNQALDIDQIARAGLTAQDWADRLPEHSAPFWSTIVFVVRDGNPKKIRDWDDLVKPGVKVVLPNPKTSGNGRYSYLAAWAFGAERGGADAARRFVQGLLASVPVFDTGGRAASTTFASRGLGDVLLTFENEVTLLRSEFGDQFEVVYPSKSIRADLPVAWIDSVVAKRGTTKLAKAYLEFLYTPEAQEIAAKLAYRPTLASVAARHRSQFPDRNLVTVESVAGSWKEALAVHFADGGIFDQLTAIR